MVDFVTWSQHLDAVSCATHGSIHPILCLTNRNNQGTRIEVLTRAQFEAEIKNQRWFQSTCHRLTLAEMVSITKASLDTYRAYPAIGKFPAMRFQLNVTRGLGLDLENAIHLGNTIDVAFVESVTKQLADATEKSRLVQRALSALQAMQERAKAKRLQEKVSSLWGKIKYYIWYWICNPEKIIQKLQCESVAAQAMKTRACSALRERIYCNICFFRDEVKVGDEPKFEEYAVPHDVKMKWIVKYAADKFDIKSAITKNWGEDPRRLDAVEDMRRRIILLNQLWENLLRLDPSQDGPERPPELATQLLIA